MAKIKSDKDTEKIQDVLEPVVEQVTEEAVFGYVPESAKEQTPEDSEEISFLKRIYRIQNDGGFGTHLNREIEERIKKLQGK